MARLIPAPHLLLIAVVSTFILIVLLALSSKQKQTQNAIKLQANLEVIDQAQLQLSNTKAPIRQPSSPLNTDTAPIQNNHPYPTENPKALKHAEPTLRLQPSSQNYSAKIVSGDSLSKILSSYGISAQDVYKVSQADRKEKDLLSMKPGQHLEFSTSSHSGDLTELTLVKNRLERILFTRNDEGNFLRNTITRKPDVVQTYKEATINNSLFVDGMKKGIEQTLLIELANIFGWDIDFALDIRKGDSFSILYEEKFLDGERIGHGNIIGAQFINNGRTYQAIRYKTATGTSYYTPDGLAMRKAFLRTPVDFTRISSKFDPNRLHPIFKTLRPHRGVDYAAASGTPVKAAGDGQVSFAGKQRGYGNVVIIDHGRGYQTLYAHLKGFAREIKRGKRVSQGKIIAYVGQTGWATGPHLHYEFRINGVHKNPVTVKLPNDAPMPKKDLQNYLPYAQKVVATLEESNSPAFAQKLALLKE